jgi:hypothetical protein
MKSLNVKKYCIDKNFFLYCPIFLPQNSLSIILSKYILFKREIIYCFVIEWESQRAVNEELSSEMKEAFDELFGLKREIATKMIDARTGRNIQQDKVKKLEFERLIFKSNRRYS